MIRSRRATSTVAALIVSVLFTLAGCSENTEPDREQADESSSTTTESATATQPAVAAEPSAAMVRTGSHQLVADDLVLLRGRSVGLVAHQASMVDGRHLADHIDDHPDVDLVALFGPEHGLRGDADAGELVEDSVDESTGAPIYSLYGETRAPTAEMLEGIEVLVYDLQDVGARYYTYISTMGLTMQSAAEAGIPFVVLDRPNPLGGHASGFVRDADVDSFVALYPIADTYGLTSGELAQAIAGEGWLPGLEDLDLRVVPMAGWTRNTRWPDTGLDWTPPSPAIQTPSSALLYPALVLFEATTVSVGRGTVLPLEVFGAPWLDGDAVTEELNALDLPGVSFEPIGFIPGGSGVLYDGEPINGVRAVVTDAARLEPANLGVHLVHTVMQQPEATDMIDNPDGFDLLAGGPTLRTELADGTTAEQIIEGRAAELAEFTELVEPYLIYPEG